MKKAFYEVVFEGHYNAIYGLLKGFLIATDKKWRFYFSRKYNINKETLVNAISDWISLKGKIHHVVMEKEFYDAFKKAIENYNDGTDNESSFVNKKYIKSERLIKNASFKFSANAYSEKYRNEIKALINTMSGGLELHDYNPTEKVNSDAKGVEMYAPEHDFIFEATGRVSGEIDELIKFRAVLDDYPLILVKNIILEF